MTCKIFRKIGCIVGSIIVWFIFIVRKILFYTTLLVLAFIAIFSMYFYFQDYIYIGGAFVPNRDGFYERATRPTGRIVTTTVKDITFSFPRAYLMRGTIYKSGFNMVALLPDLEHRSSDNRHHFDEPGYGAKVFISVSLSHFSTEEQFWNQMRSKNMENLIINYNSNAIQRVYSDEKHYGWYVTYIVVDKGSILYYIRCDNNIKGQSKACSIKMDYRKGIVIRARYSQKYFDDSLSIASSVMRLIESLDVSSRIQDVDN